MRHEIHMHYSRDRLSEEKVSKIWRVLVPEKNWKTGEVRENGIALCPGIPNVLSGALYGYRYVKKTETSAANYDIIEEEAATVRHVFQW